MAANTDNLQLLKELSAREIKWTLNLDCFILKTLPIPMQELVWVVASEENVFLVDTRKGKAIQKFKNVAEYIFSAVIHPLTNELFIATDQGIFLLSTEGETTHVVKESNWFEQIAISDDGKVVFTAKGKILYILIQKESGYELVGQDNSFKSTISDIIFNVDSFLVSNYGSVREYKTTDFDHYQSFDLNTSLLTTSWSPDKKFIAVGTQENEIHLWPYPFDNEDDFQISGYPSKVSKIKWSNDSTKFVVNCANDVQVWDFSEGAPTGKSPVTLKCGLGKIVDISYKGRILVAASERGFLFYFRPSFSKNFAQVHSVEREISCISMNYNESKLFVGTQPGKLYCFKVTI